MHDLVTLGEVLLRLSLPSPARFETVRELDVQIGGAEANVAAASWRFEKSSSRTRQPRSSMKPLGMAALSLDRDRAQEFAAR